MKDGLCMVHDAFRDECFCFTFFFKHTTYFKTTDIFKKQISCFDLVINKCSLYQLGTGAHQGWAPG